MDQLQDKVWSLENEFRQIKLQEKLLEQRALEKNVIKNKINQELVNILIEAGTERQEFHNLWNKITVEDTYTAEDLDNCYNHYEKSKALDAMFIAWGKHWVDKGLGLHFSPILRHELNTMIHGNTNDLAKRLEHAKNSIKLSKKLKKTPSLPNLGPM